MAMEDDSNALYCFGLLHTRHHPLELNAKQWTKQVTIAPSAEVI